MREALVFGGSGQIGMPLLRRLHEHDWRVAAVSRAHRMDDGDVRWLRGDLDHVEGLPRTVDAIFSCGPLDHFARWYAASTIHAPRVVAFGSTSVAVKHDSVDAHERDVAQRLQVGEFTLFASAATRGAAATVLRPTLVYGAGRDRTLSRIAHIARRWHRFALPNDACGLRQPVHVDDLADAAFACLAASSCNGRAYDLPGGETLPYREMVTRVLATLSPPPRLHLLPPAWFVLALHGARVSGRDGGLGAAALARMREDLVFDAAPAARDLGYAPRPFRPDAAMFSVD